MPKKLGKDTLEQALTFVTILKDMLRELGYENLAKKI